MFKRLAGANFPPCPTSLFGDNLVESVKSINKVSKLSDKMGPPRKSDTANSLSRFHPEAGASDREEEEEVASEGEAEGLLMPLLQMLQTPWDPFPATPPPAPTRPGAPPPK